MPTYEYRCPAGHDTERFFRKISDSTSQVECPECGAIAERRLSGGGGLLFKGSGFYLTDYGRSGAKPKKDGAEGGGGDSGGKPGDAAKPAASSDAKGSSSTGDSAKSGGTSKKKE